MTTFEENAEKRATSPQKGLNENTSLPASATGNSSTSPGVKPPIPCSICEKTFSPRLAYQLDAKGVAFCSLPCRASPGEVACCVCKTRFVPRLAFQAIKLHAKKDTQYVCTQGCREAFKVALQQAKNPAPPPRQILAVLNQKGGVGKTTTSVNLAAGLAEKGHHVLLIDADPQGNVGVSLGVRSPLTLYDIILNNRSIEDVAVPMGEHFDVVTADEKLAQAEIVLAQRPTRASLLKAALDKTTDYTHVIIDCGPSLSLINQNALCAADEVLVPVACDYLSLVGVKQVLKTIDRVNSELGHPLKVGGVLPTFYDGRARVCQDALKTMQDHFGELCLTPIRNNIRLKEAPSQKRTIFEHAPQSHGAEDYLRVVEWALKRHPVAAKPPAKPSEKLSGQHLGMQKAALAS
ncbi:MAG: ParA family protein [Deltaproteobacteria bacterium]|nr:ParA family protein [Deltaproteobacteria bacterium]